MKLVLGTSAVIAATTAVCLPLAQSTAFAQTNNWTVESVELRGTVATTKFDGGGSAMINIIYDADQDLAEVYLVQGQQVILRVEQDEETGQNEEEGNEPNQNLATGRVQASTSNAKYLFKIKGPTGCAGQTDTVKFLVKSHSTAVATVTGDGYYDIENVSDEEEITVWKPSPPSTATVSASANILGRSASSNVVQTTPPSGTTSDVKDWKSKLIVLQVTYDANERAEVEVPFSLEASAQYNTPWVETNDGGPLMPTTKRTIGQAAVAVAPDTRAVKLTRNNRDRFVNVGGQWITYGKTCNSYHVTSPTSDPGAWHWNFQQIAANLEGNWSSLGAATSITWDWAPGTPLQPSPYNVDSKYYAHRLAPMGGLTWHRYYDEQLNPHEKWTGTGIAPQTATITYEATDQGDDAKSVATYVLELHEPVELDHINQYAVFSYSPVWGSGSGGDSAEAGDASSVMRVEGPILLDDSIPEPSCTVGKGYSKGYSQAVSGEFELGDIASVLGYSVSWSEEQERYVESQIPVNIVVPPNMITYPIFEFAYMRQHYNYRHFNEEGEHELPPLEDPPGSGIFDPQYHQIVVDQPNGVSVMWADPIDALTGVIPTSASGPSTYKSQRTASSTVRVEGRSS